MKNIFKRKCKCCGGTGKVQNLPLARGTKTCPECGGKGK